MGTVDVDEKKEEKPKTPSLITIVQRNKLEFWIDQADRAWVTIMHSDSGPVHYPVWSADFGYFLTWLYNQETQLAIDEAHLKRTRSLIDAMAHMEGKRHEIFVRVASDKDELIIDLADDKGAVIRVSKEGWDTEINYDIRFQRSKDIRSLPAPERGGNLDELWTIFNVTDPGDRVLLIAFITYCYRYGVPYPILEVLGDKGRAKTTLVNGIKALVDPQFVDISGAPRTEEDLLISALHCWLAAFDNMSNVPDWLSDVMARIATGTGSNKRKLYTDLEQTGVVLKRPQIISGINRLALRADLLDRVVSIELPYISPEKRLDDQTSRAMFAATKGRLLGALLDATSIALRNLDVAKERSTELPRMADFALWGRALDLGLRWGGLFDEAYREKLAESRATVIDDSIIVRYLAPLVGFEGGMGALLDQINEKAKDGEKRSKAWPKNPNHLGQQISRLEDTLRATLGIIIERDRLTNQARTRIVRIKTVGNIVPLPAAKQAATERAEAMPY